MSEEKENSHNNNNLNKDVQDENMAVEFPKWDILPPDLLLKRGKNENA